MTHHAFRKMAVLAMVTLSFVHCKKDSDFKPQNPAGNTAVPSISKISTSQNDHKVYTYNDAKQLMAYRFYRTDNRGIFYDVTTHYTYENGKIVRATSPAGRHEYIYEDGILVRVDVFSPNGSKYVTLHPVMNPQKKVTEILETLANPNPGGPIQTKATYTYHADGNIKRIAYSYRNDLGAAFEEKTVEDFETFDSKSYGEHDFPMGIYLPGVALQKNNLLTSKVTIDRAASPLYVSSYTYTYGPKGEVTTKTLKRMWNGVEDQPVTYDYTY